MPTDLCVEPQSEEDARKCAQEPRNAQHHGSVVPIIQLSHLVCLGEIRLVSIFARVVDGTVRLTPGHRHDRCAQAGGYTWRKGRKPSTRKRDAQQGNKIRPRLYTFIHMHERQHQWREHLWLTSTCKKPRHLSQQVAAASQYTHVSHHAGACGQGSVALDRTMCTPRES